MPSNLILLLEVLLIFGGVFVFGFWQLRSLRRDAERAARSSAEPLNRDDGGPGTAA